MKRICQYIDSNEKSPLYPPLKKGGKTDKDPLQMRISVIVPIHNAERTLGVCLKALQGQTDSNYNIILVNDCSTDSSARICSESGIKTIHLSANKGQAVARNIGVEQSDGEIIAFVDADAVVPPDWISKYRELLCIYNDAEMICSGYADTGENNHPSLFALHESLYRRMHIPCYITSSTSSNCIIYRRTFEEINGYPEYYINARGNKDTHKAVSTNEDAEIGFLLTSKGKKIVWSKENPVRHYFRNSWKGYLKQQIGFSRYSVLSLFKFPGMFFQQDIYNKEKTAVQTLICSVMIFGLFGLFWGLLRTVIAVFIEITCLAAFYFFNRKFIKYLRDNMPNYYFPRVFFLLVVTRLCWIYGISCGLKDGCWMMWNNRGEKNECPVNYAASA